MVGVKSYQELLLPDPERKPTFLNDKIGPIIVSVLGFTGVCYVNWGQRRPVFSGIQKHIFAIVGGYAVGMYLDKKRNDYFAEKDAVLRHYIELHPEDFPPPERKKFSEVFLPWHPIR